MKAESLPTVVGAILCLAISAGVIYGIFDQMQGTAKKNAQQRMDSGSIGPLDDAMADMAGVARRPKIKFSLPQSKSVLPDFSYSPNFKSFND